MDEAYIQLKKKIEEFNESGENGYKIHQNYLYSYSKYVYQFLVRKALKNFEKNFSVCKPLDHKYRFEF